MPPAVIAAAVGGAAALGGAAINKSATNKATKAAEEAAARNAAIQQQQYQQTRSDLQPYTQAGYAGTGGILDYYGLRNSGQRAPSQASSVNVYTPQQATGGQPMGSGLSRLASGFANAPSAPPGGWGNTYDNPMDPRYTQGGNFGGGPAAPQGGEFYAGSGTGAPDYNAYIAQNPDIAAYMQANPQDVAAQGGPEAYAAAHYQAYGQAEGRQLPTTGGSPATAGEGGYTGPTFDPTGPARPDTGARPTDYGAAPTFDQFFDPNPTQGYRDELQRTTRALNGAAGMEGSYFSGNRGLKLQDNADRLYRADEQNRFNRANSLYQSALGQFNTNRTFANANYDVDATRSDARFEVDRNYGANRQDTRTNDLFRLTQIGAQSAGAMANAGQNYANNATSNNNNLASVTGNAALAGASNTNALIGDAMKAYAIFGGGGTNNTLANKPYNSGWKI